MYAKILWVNAAADGFCHISIDDTFGGLQLIGKKELAFMEDFVILVNTSRGSVIDQGALITSLRNEKAQVRSLGTRVGQAVRIIMETKATG